MKGERVYKESLNAGYVPLSRDSLLEKKRNVRAYMHYITNVHGNRTIILI